MFDAYLQLDGVAGEATRMGFEGQIEIKSFNLGASNESSIGNGSGGGGTGKASLSPLTITKFADAASPLLLQACCEGVHYPTARIVLNKAGGGESVDYLVLELDKVYIQSVDWHGAADSDARAMERLEISYGKITATYTPQTDTGVKGSPIVGSWDQVKVSA